MKMLDTVTGVGQHQTTVEVTHVYGAVAIETKWVDDPDIMVYSMYARPKALRLAWAIIKAALTFRRFK